MQLGQPRRGVGRQQRARSCSQPYTAATAGHASRHRPSSRCGRACPASDCTSSAGAPPARPWPWPRPSAGRHQHAQRALQQAGRAQPQQHGRRPPPRWRLAQRPASKPAATNSVPRPTAASTASSVRSTTPAWQTSNTEGGPRGFAGLAGHHVSSSAAPKPVLRASAAGVGAQGVGLGVHRLKGGAE